MNDLEKATPLELLESIGVGLTQNNGGVFASKEVGEAYWKIHQALERLEQIEQVKPSEAIKCLESMYARLPQWDLCRNLDQYNTIKQALQQAENCSGARRNGKALEQMYQLVQYSKPPMKPAIWVAKIDDKLEQRVIIEKEEYNKLTINSKKAKAFDVIKEKGVDVVKLIFCNNLTEYYGDGYEKFIINPLTKEEFDLLKEELEK